MSFWTMTTAELLSPNPATASWVAILGCGVVIILLIIMSISQCGPYKEDRPTPRMWLAMLAYTVLTGYYVQWAMLVWPVWLVYWLVTSGISNDFEKPWSPTKAFAEYKQHKLERATNRSLSRADKP
jgi:hypothetical protein